MIIPFLNFTGQANEAINFYESIFKVENKNVMLFKDMPADVKSEFPAGTENYVAHAEMTIEGTQVWIGDSLQAVADGEKVSLSLLLSSEEEIRKVFDRLKAEGTILMELEPTFYSRLCGMVKDKFGIIWFLMLGMCES